MPLQKQIQNPYQIYPDEGEPFDFWAAPVYVATQETGPSHGVSAGEYFTPGIYGATYAANPWDRVIIGNSALPGICTVQVKKGRDTDKKKAAGSDGARYTVHGIDPAEVTIMVKLWAPEQYRQLLLIWNTMFPGPVKRSKTRTITQPATARRQTSGDSRQVIPQVPQTKKITTSTLVTQTIPFDVNHPLFDLHKIKSLLFLEGTGPDPADVPRAKMFTIKAVEFLNPSKNNVTTTPVASKGSVYDPPKQATPGTNPKNLAP